MITKLQLINIIIIILLLKHNGYASPDSYVSSLFNSDLTSFHFLSCFTRDTSIPVLSSDIINKWLAQSSLYNVIVVTAFNSLYITCNLSLFQILRPFWSFIGSSFKLNVSRSHDIRYDFIGCVIVYDLQQYNILSLIIVGNIFSFVCFDIIIF